MSCDTERVSADIQAENDINTYIMAVLDGELKAAEKKHPNFANGIHQGLGVIGIKYGELCQALGKAQREDSVRDETLALLCAVWRFYRGDWQTRGPYSRE